MNATINVHPKNPHMRVIGVRLKAGDVITRDVLFASPSGSWLPVKSGAVNLRLSSGNSIFVRPVKTFTVEAPSAAEWEALRICTDKNVTGGLSETLASLLRKLEVGSLLTEIGRAA
jgi:hypothetical protein